MNEVTKSDVERLIQILSDGETRELSLGCTVGEKSVAAGFWRFFSADWPCGGFGQWNQQSGWKDAWAGNLPRQMHCFGEDSFGNQLVFVGDDDQVQLWSHENGQLLDLYLEPSKLLETVMSHGVEWIDLYKDGSAEVARQFGLPSEKHHLHWNTPLMLGGRVCVDNLSLAERAEHLSGHGKLWRQVQGIPLGTSVNLG